MGMLGALMLSSRVGMERMKSRKKEEERLARSVWSRGDVTFRASDIKREGKAGTLYVVGVRSDMPHKVMIPLSRLALEWDRHHPDEPEEPQPL